ncbi:MAG: hypothetical protein K0Q72_3400 [Armatimonadetes bacterium]|jgi:hypothetical protein|nr:hypothetical protein [Armatimonadota bacterium]
MSVYFVYRSHYAGPTCQHVRRFEDESVLAWFQARWEGAADPDAAYARVKELLGTDVYGFNSLFTAIAESSLPCPKTARQLAELLEEHLYYEGELLCKPHAIQVLTDDDELELSYYFFDDHYLERRPNATAYLLREDWRLPEGAAEGAVKPVATSRVRPSGHGEGTVYLAFIAYYDSGSLSDQEGGYRIQGIHLPELCRYLAAHSPQGEWPFELLLLRSQLTADEAGNPLSQALEACGRLPLVHLYDDLGDGDSLTGGPQSAREVVESHLEESGEQPEERRSLVQVEEHVAQLCLHVDRWGDRDLYHRWILFDDLWLAANPALGNAILTYVKRWDVL